MTERKFKEMTMPTGIVFRQYEDDHFKWIQVAKWVEVDGCYSELVPSDEPDWLEPLYEAFANGSLK